MLDLDAWGPTWMLWNLVRWSVINQVQSGDAHPCEFEINKRPRPRDPSRRNLICTNTIEAVILYMFTFYVGAEDVCVVNDG